MIADNGAARDFYLVIVDEGTTKINYHIPNKLLTVYHRIDSKSRSQSESGICDRALVDIF